MKTHAAWRCQMHSSYRAGQAGPELSGTYGCSKCTSNYKISRLRNIIFHMNKLEINEISTGKYSINFLWNRDASGSRLTGSQFWINNLTDLRIPTVMSSFLFVPVFGIVDDGISAGNDNTEDWRRLVFVVRRVIVAADKKCVNTGGDTEQHVSSCACTRCLFLGSFFPIIPCRSSQMS